MNYDFLYDPSQSREQRRSQEKRAPSRRSNKTGSKDSSLGDKMLSPDFVSSPEGEEISHVEAARRFRIQEDEQKGESPL